MQYFASHWGQFWERTVRIHDEEHWLRLINRRKKKKLKRRKTPFPSLGISCITLKINLGACVHDEEHWLWLMSKSGQKHIKETKSAVPESRLFFSVPNETRSKSSLKTLYTFPGRCITCLVKPLEDTRCYRGVKRPHYSSTISCMIWRRGVGSVDLPHLLGRYGGHWVTLLHAFLETMD